MSNIKAWKLLSLFCLFTALIGCQSKEEQLQQTIQESIKKADVELTQLGKALDNGSIRNAIILKEYSRILKQQQPELSKVVDVVSLDATRQGALYSGLTQRLDDIKGNYLIPPYEDTLYNIDLLREAAKPTLFFTYHDLRRARFCYCCYEPILNYCYNYSLLSNCCDF